MSAPPRWNWVVADDPRRCSPTSGTAARWRAVVVQRLMVAGAFDSLYGIGLSAPVRRRSPRHRRDLLEWPTSTATPRHGAVSALRRRHEPHLAASPPERARRTTSCGRRPPPMSARRPPRHDLDTYSSPSTSLGRARVAPSAACRNDRRRAGARRARRCSASTQATTSSTSQPIGRSGCTLARPARAWLIQSGCSSPG